MPRLPFGINHKRRRFFFMKRTARLPIYTGLFQRHIFGNKLRNVQFIFDLLGVSHILYFSTLPQRTTKINCYTIIIYLVQDYHLTFEFATSRDFERRLSY